MDPELDKQWKETGETKSRRGIITLAHGDARYYCMAKYLARSLEVHSSSVTRAIVTDSKDRDLLSLYHLTIPFRSEYGRGFSQKLFLDQYSPFDETLFIDADCLNVGNIEQIWRYYSTATFSIMGYNIRDGYWYGEVKNILSTFNFDHIPQFNSGVIFFRSVSQSRAIFQEARELVTQYDQLGLARSQGEVADEPVFAIAMAKHGIDALDDSGSIMRTPIGMVGFMKIDVLKGYCSFIKGDTLVKPAIAHFAGPWARGFYYKRECLKLNLRSNTPLPKALISHIANVCNPVYCVWKHGRTRLCRWGLWR